MIILRDPGEVFALRHTLSRRPLTRPTTAWVERIDPESLTPIGRSPELPGGPFWPGGLAAHACGDLHVVYGSWCHRLSPALEPLASAELPGPRPHNSFVVLPDGSLVTKDFDRRLTAPATLTVLDPITLAPRGPLVRMPEAVIARLSADGATVYAVGATTVWRLHWDGARLILDSDWAIPYRGAEQGYGWDPVVSGGQVWFLDNGEHDYATTMLGAGSARGPVHLIRIACADPSDREQVEVCGLPGGAVTDPPLFDATRGIAVAYDSANGVVQAFRLRDTLTPLWRRELNHAAHMVLRQPAGELVMHDFRPAPGTTTRAFRKLANALPSPAGVGPVRRTLSRLSGDEVVVLDIETGRERARARVPTMFQSVLFPTPGFANDLYWCTFSTIARLQCS